MEDNNVKQSSYAQIVAGLGVLILSLVVLYFTAPHWYLSLAPLIILLVAFHYHNKLGKLWQGAIVGLTIAVIITYALQDIARMQSNVSQIYEWDFMGFWIGGRAAVQGVNFYQAEQYHRIAQVLSPSVAFTHEIIDIGFWYPPPSMLLFAPLGWFDNIQTAYVFWYAFNSVVIVLDIVLLWKLFLGESGLRGLGLVAAMLLLLHPTLATIGFGQTAFVALLMLLLFWQDRLRPRSGIWLTIGIFVKPFLAFLLIYFVVKRKWRALLTTFASAVVISLISIVLFSPSTFLTYFQANQASKVSSFVDTTGQGQSLQHFFEYSLQGSIGSNPSLMRILFYVSAAVMIAISAWVLFQADESRLDWKIALLVPLSLAVYPNTGEHYAVVLLPGLLLFWAHRNELPVPPWGAIVFIVVEYALVSVNADLSLLMMLLNWLVLLLVQTPITLPESQPKLDTA